MKETDLAELNRKVEELHRQQPEESERELKEIVARSGFKNGAEALQAFRDLSDVVSHYRAGRLPTGYARLRATGPHCIAFATAAELRLGSHS